ncbi:flagellar basal-body rod protein FlgC [Thermanaeromonas toyohensis ToBE]|uniref:Flagellar basal-body rod protein FlgC n=1 Tax=Thermanaeromonas toyohensis ToBE TaxID=698762 RepID=A0A1W1VL77_9FIRM|nr:flagellar basal body rod protein FlgC [Thermanaeromonas toyohensis]SMB93970.1 flagellar basal-body rod protein FlgC [Thermanaeromonas toyohensis ToBE]
MELLPGLAISASGLTAERLRLDLIASNLANIYTTRTARGGPYRRKVAIFAERLRELKGIPGPQAPGYGVRVVGIAEDNTPPRLVYDPTHPDADTRGYVALPNINVVNEMIDLITASRAYEANVIAFNAAKSMALKALEIGRV